MRMSLRIASALMAACLAPSMASAAPVLGGSVFVTNTGNVTATFQGSTAGYDSLLYLDSPANMFGAIFHNHANSIGDTFDLGSFTAGTELIFRIEVLNTGNNWYTGPAFRNADGVPHNVVDNLPGGDTYVGFEDLAVSEFPDNDYDDLNFSFTNTAVPEPASALLAMGAVAGMFVRRNRRSA